MDAIATSPVDLAYRDECRRLYRQAATTACILGIVIVPAFLILDHIISPRHFHFFLVLRLACVGTLLAIMGLLRSRAGERWALGLCVAVALDVGLMVDVMTIMTGGHASPYYAGINLVILACALVMPWPPACAGLTCAVLIAGYVACSFVEGPIVDPRIFVSNLVFLVTTAVITVVGSAVRDTMRRREYVVRTALSEAVRHKDAFLARMTHELRTPIHVMVGYADILLEEGLAAGEGEARPLVTSIRTHGVLLHSLVSDLLDYAKVHAGKMEVRPERVAVQQLVEQVAESFRPLTERKGLRLRTAYPHGSQTLTSDRQKIQQILNNLVGNALKFTDRGTISIEVRQRLDTGGVTLLCEPETASVGEAGIYLLVRDTGIGIRDSDLRALAADFQQIDAGPSARYGGTGLGLSISKRFAQLLGGWIGVSSRFGEGSTFVVFLPTLGAPADADMARRSAA
jgi:signal transduction histidine kinase